MTSTTSSCSAEPIPLIQVPKPHYLQHNPPLNQFQQLRLLRKRNEDQVDQEVPLRPKIIKVHLHR